MEDYLGIIIFLIFAGLSVAKRMGGGQEKKGPQRAPRDFEFPTAPRPAEGGARPRPPQPSWPKAPQPSYPQAPPPVAQPKKVEPTRLKESVGDEWSGEGPSPEERFDAVSAQFDQDTSGLRDREMGTGWGGAFRKESELLSDRRIPQGWTEGLSELDESVIARSEGITIDLAEIRNPNNMAKAVVMAEILGRPKGRRRRR